MKKIEKYGAYFVCLQVGSNLKYYLVYLMNHSTLPDKFLTYRNKILLFKSYRQAREYMKNVDCIRKIDNEVFFCNIPLIKKTIAHKQNNGTVVSFFSVLCDALLSISISEKYEIISTQEFAEFICYATFKYDLKPFFVENKEITSEKLQAFIDWSIGAILNNSKLMR